MEETIRALIEAKGNKFWVNAMLTEVIIDGLEGDGVHDHTRFTCYYCGCHQVESPWNGRSQESNCGYAWDLYNTEGDCIVEK